MCKEEGVLTGLELKSTSHNRHQKIDDHAQWSQDIIEEEKPNKNRLLLDKPKGLIKRPILDKCRKQRKDVESLKLPETK